MGPISYGQLLRENHDFRNLWLGQCVSQLGDWFNLITLQALILHLTGSRQVLAYFLVAQMLPGFLLGPVAGVIVDRLPRKQVMIVADLARAFVALGFLFVRSAETVWIAYVCIALLSCFAVFFEPARTATLPNVTASDELVTANALSAVTWSTLLTAGALVGGLVARFLGTDAAFLLNAATFLGSAVFIGRVRVPPTVAAPREGSHARQGFRDILAGLRYVRQRPDLLAVLSVKPGWGLSGGLNLLIPVLGAQYFALRGDPRGNLSISLLFAASGLGTALGPIIARRTFGSSEGRMRAAIAFNYLWGGFFMLLLTWTGSLASSGLLLFLSRFGGSIVWVYSTILLQTLTPDEYRGRVFATEMMFFTLTMMLSSVGVAWAMDRAGVTPFAAVAVLGALSLGLGLCWCVGLGLKRPRAAE